MSNEPRPIGPYDDPRLVDRRGDLSGFSALMFAGLALLALALVGLVLFLAAPPTTPGATPSSSPSPTPTPSPTRAAPTPRLSGSGLASPGQAASPGQPAPVGVAAVGEPIPLVVDGNQVGTVTVQATRYSRNVGGEPARAGARYLIARIRYRATAPLEYDAANWVAIDGEGSEYPWRGSGDPEPSMGAGSLAAGGSVTGNASFEVRRAVPVVALALRSAGGDELARVELE